MKKEKVKEPADKGEILTELIKAHMQRFDNTRRIQWTFNGLFWTGILVTAPFLHGTHNYDPDKDNNFFIYSMFVTIAYSIVVILFQRSLNWDKEKFKQYRTILEKMISIPELKDKQIISWGVVWTFVQFVVTILLLMGVYFVIQR